MKPKNQNPAEAQTTYVRVEGMFCAHCEETVSLALKTLAGVSAVRVRQNVAQVTSDVPLQTDDVIRAIRAAGYETDAGKISTQRRKVARTVRWYEFLLISAAVVLVAAGVNKIFGYNIFNAIPAVDSSASYGMLFVTGLLTGIHCVGMCGAIGIYASVDQSGARSLRRPLLYNAGRVVSYTLIGGIVGLIGTVFSISAKLRGAVILVSAVLMLLMALSMLGLVDFHLPRFLKAKKTNRKHGAFLIGLLNGLMPCGPLQAMQIYALSTGSFFSGATAMLLFSLGTVPLMLASGAAINLSRGKAKIVIGKVAAVLVLLLSLFMLNRGLLGLGVDVAKLLPQKYDGYTAAVMEDGVQTVRLELEYDSFGDVIVQRGIPVKLTIHAEKEKITGCNNEVVSADFGCDVPLKPGDNLITFTPTETGEFTYTCWMNMIRNQIKVIDDPDYFSKGD